MSKKICISCGQVLKSEKYVPWATCEKCKELFKKLKK